MPRPDSELVGAARGGDTGAFAALAERHYPLLLASCRRGLADPQRAHDAAQEAVLTALLGIARLRDDEQFGSWLIGIGLNVCRRLSRTERRRPSLSLEALAEPVSPGPGPAEAAESAEAAALVRGAIASLPAGQREAVRLFYLGGLTHAETAEELGTAVSAVKTRLHKARSSLKRRLHDLREEPHPMTDRPVSMHVAELRRTAGTPVHHVVFLAEDGGERRLPIWIGAAEALALACLLEDVELPRPGPHDLAAALLAAAGGRLAEVRINRLTDAVFYAEVALGDGATVDARPSDALTLALAAGAPISVDPAVLEQAARTERAFGEELGEALGAVDDARTLADEMRSQMAETTAETAELAARAREVME